MVFAQTQSPAAADAANAIVILVLLLFILLLILVAALFMSFKVKSLIEENTNLTDEGANGALGKRKAALDYSLRHDELSGSLSPADEKGVISYVNTDAYMPFVALKKRALKRPNIDPQLSKLIIWYIGCATVRFRCGTTVGEYLGIKFVSLGADHICWLGFGRPP